MELELLKQSALKLQDNATALLKALIECNTTDYHEHNGQKKLIPILKDMGADVTLLYPDCQSLSAYPQFNSGHSYEDRPCVVAKFRGYGAGRSILLNAHMDTVFPASPKEWLTDPFHAIEKNGRIYGLGACDTKGGMVAMLMAIQLLKNIGVQLKGDIIFTSVVDEEAGGGNGSLACIDAGCHADAVLVAEPTGMNPASVQIGSYAMYLTIEGKSAHGNRKKDGISAFEKAMPIINRLSQLEQKWSKRNFNLLQPPVISVLSIEAGDGSITLPGQCKMLINYTYHPDGYDYHSEIMAVIRECEAQDEWLREHPVQIALHHNCGPYYTDPNSEWPHIVSETASQVLERNMPVVGLPCGSDGRLFATVGNMPTVVMGPGDIANAHQPNEFIGIDELVDAICVYAKLLCDWCGGEES